jgi:hypothetical protein
MIRLLAILLVALLPISAHAVDDKEAWDVWYNIGVLDNCSAASINSAVVCGGTRGIKVEGYNVLTLEISYTLSAGTGWKYYLETCYEGHASTDCTDATDWHQVAITQATPGTGVQLTADPVTHTAVATDRIVYSFGINYRRIRLNGFIALGTPDANDKITVNGRAAWTSAF